MPPRFGNAVASTGTCAAAPWIGKSSWTEAGDGALTLNVDKQTLKPYVLEINTMPGMTPTSMFPQMWAATGLEYPKVVDRLIRTALHRGTGLH